MPFLMLWSVLTTSRLEPDQDAHGVLVGAPADLVRVLMGIADDAAALRVRDVHQPALVDEEGGLLLGLRDDPLRLVLGLLDDPFALGIDALRCPNLLRDRHTQLIDQPERGVLVHDDVGGQRQLLAVRDERLEALDEEDDVDGSALHGG